MNWCLTIDVNCSSDIALVTLGKGVHSTLSVYIDGVLMFGLDLFVCAVFVSV